MAFKLHPPFRLAALARLRRAASLAPLVAASCGVTLAEGPQEVRTRPDPFAQLHLLNAGRSTSTWSSLPSDIGCADDARAGSGHALLLIESSEAWQDTQPGLFSLVEPRHRLQLDTTGQWGCVFGQLAVQRQIDPSGDYWSWDGSAISWRIDEHWRIGAGRIARHWGPGWDGSLILGTAARPFPSVSVDADSGPLSASKWWWWLGEVQFSGFLGQLESDRADVSKPWLMGMRLVLRPREWLELGLSRTMQFGGEGRDNSPKTFLKALLGRDNHCNASDCSNQPGNQLGGYDARLSLDRWLPGVALYGQLIGEDSRPDDVPVPAKNMYLAGAAWHRDDALVFVEWTDSQAKVAGIAYNHSIYTDGYRYKGRPLGYWADGDSNLWTVGSLQNGLFGGQALAVLRYGSLNASGANTSWPDARLSSASLQWRKRFDRDFALTIALDHQELSQMQAGGPQNWRNTQLRVQLDGWLH
jgi:hypothetical protein